MIRLDQPRNWDLVGDPILIAGIGTGFEATFAYRIGEGHDEITGHIMAGGGTGEHAQFQKRVKIGDRAFMLDRLFVEVFEYSMADGSELHKTSRPVIYGPRIVDGYYGYREHTVAKGETLSSIARQHYGSSDWSPIQRANAGWFGEDDEIYPGQLFKVPIGNGP